MHLFNLLVLYRDDFFLLVNHVLLLLDCTGHLLLLLEDELLRLSFFDALSFELHEAFLHDDTFRSRSLFLQELLILGGLAACFNEFTSCRWWQATNRLQAVDRILMQGQSEPIGVDLVLVVCFFSCEM